MPGLRRRLTVAALVAIVVVAGVVVAEWPGLIDRSGPSAPPTFVISDLTPDLGSVFHPGIILGAGSNATTTLLAGIGVYSRTTDFSLPVLAAIEDGPAGVEVANLTARVSSAFFDGGVYGLGSNGAMWLVGGQTSWEASNRGALVALEPNGVVNLTDRLGSLFDGGGVFAIGWNGSSWLLGGNSSTGPVLAAWDGTHLTDLTARLVSYDRSGWVQLLAWNGHEWLIGGQGVFGLLQGGVFHDLDPASPFGASGEFSAAWTGRDWIVGGSGARVVLVSADRILPGPTLPSSFDRFVTLVTPIGHGWLLGGRGSVGATGYAPELFYWSGGSGAGSLVNLTAEIPPSFAGGEIQGGSAAPILGSSSVLIVGEGAYNAGTGHGVGSIALVTPS